MDGSVDVWRLVAYWDDHRSIRDWARRDGHELRRAWATCPQPEWSLYLADQLVVRPLVVRAACAALRVPSSAHSMNDPAVLALDAAERWARGEASIDELRSAMPSRPVHGDGWIVADGAAIVLRSIIEGSPRLIHNAGMRATQALGGSPAAARRCAAAVADALPYDVLAESCAERGPPSDPSLWALLERLEFMLPSEVAWARPFGGDVVAAWAACREPAWLVEIAVSAGVSPRLVVEAVLDCVAEMCAACSALPPHASAAMTAVRGWCQGRVDAAAIEALAEPVEEAMSATATAGDETFFALRSIELVLAACLDASDAARAIYETARSLESLRPSSNSAIATTFMTHVRRRILASDITDALVRASPA